MYASVVISEFRNLIGLSGLLMQIGHRLSWWGGGWFTDLYMSRYEGRGLWDRVYKSGRLGYHFQGNCSDQLADNFSLD